jgi:hypothetical protein
MDSGEKTGVQNCIILVLIIETSCTAFVSLCLCNSVHYDSNHSFVLLYSERKDLLKVPEVFGARRLSPSGMFILL